jgi:hypothetical protein
MRQNDLKALRKDDDDMEALFSCRLPACLACALAGLWTTVLARGVFATILFTLRYIDRSVIGDVPFDAVVHAFLELGAGTRSKTSDRFCWYAVKLILLSDECRRERGGAGHHGAACDGQHDEAEGER